VTQLMSLVLRLDPVHVDYREIRCTFNDDTNSLCVLCPCTIHPTSTMGAPNTDAANPCMWFTLNPNDASNSYTIRKQTMVLEHDNVSDPDIAAAREELEQTLRAAACGGVLEAAGAATEKIPLSTESTTQDLTHPLPPPSPPLEMQKEGTDSYKLGSAAIPPSPLNAARLRDGGVLSDPSSPARVLNLSSAQDVAWLTDEMKKQVLQGKQLVIDPDGEMLVLIAGAGQVPTSFQAEANISAVLSHRWGTVAEVNGGDFPTGFLQARFEATTWVDALSHLNDAELVQHTIASMGQLYAQKPCRALFFEHDLQTAWDGMVRGWMWQELVPGPQAHAYAASEIHALHILYRNRELTSLMANYERADGSSPFKAGGMADRCSRVATEVREGLDGSWQQVPRGFSSWHSYAVDRLGQMHYGSDAAAGEQSARPAMQLLSSIFEHLNDGREHSDSGQSLFESLCNLCKAILCSDDSLVMEEKHRKALSEILPLVAPHDEERSAADLVPDAISHLSCTNYTKASDCVQASFGVILSKAGRTVDAQTVQDLIHQNIDEFLRRFQYRVHSPPPTVSPFPAIFDPIGQVNGNALLSSRVLGITSLEFQLVAEEHVLAMEWWMRGEERNRSGRARFLHGSSPKLTAAVGAVPLSACDFDACATGSSEAASTAPEHASAEAGAALRREREASSAAMDVVAQRLACLAPDALLRALAAAMLHKLCKYLEREPGRCPREHSLQHELGGSGMHAWEFSCAGNLDAERCVQRGLASLGTTSCTPGSAVSRWGCAECHFFMCLPCYERDCTRSSKSPVSELLIESQRSVRMAGLPSGRDDLD